MGLEDTKNAPLSEGTSFHQEILESDGEEFFLLRPEVVATMLGLSKPRVYQLAETGEIPSVKIGKSTRFFRDDVRQYILSRRRNGKSL